MEITSLIFQKNNPKRVNLFVDGKFLIGISAELVFTDKLKVGKVLNGEEVNDLVLKSLREILLDSAFYFLSVRPRSQKEVEIRLKEKIAKIKFKSKEIFVDKLQIEKKISEVIDKLKNLGLVNDESFIKWWFNQRQEFRGKSLRAIKLELLQKGINEKLIDEVLKNRDTSKNEAEMAMNLVAKRMPRWSGFDKKKIKEKIYAYLLPRGFDYETIKTVIDTVWQKD